MLNEGIDLEFEEEQRVRALRALNLLDTAAEPEFDELVELATSICHVHGGAMTLIDSKRQFLKSAINALCPTEIPRDLSFCTHTIRQDGVMVVEDALQDDRFFDHPLALQTPGLRFYAGATLRAPGGEHIGALCVMDPDPQKLSPEQVRSLEIIARQIEARLVLRQREQAMLEFSREIARSRDSFHAFVNAIPVEAYLKDAEGRIIFYNRRLANRFNISQDDWIGKTSHDLWPADVADRIRLEERHVLRTGKTLESYTEVPEGDGKSSFWKNIRVPFEQNGQTLIAVVAIDLSADLEREQYLQQVQDDLEAANRKLQALSLTDELTGLWNRRAFDQRLTEELARTRRTREPLTLAMVDLDNFKQINDTWGHPFGDTVLQRMADLMASSKRTEDIAVRYGGEEFALLLPLADEAGARMVCERLLSNMRDTDWGHRAITASVGLATIRGDFSREELLRRADHALYEAKRQGKNRCTFYNPAEGL